MTRSALAALLAASALAPAAAHAQTCNLGCDPCSGAPPCLGGCPTTLPVRHASGAPCTTGGSLDFGATEFATTPPPLRFWQHDRYALANSGCHRPALASAGAGRWVVTGGDWAAPLVDGCLDPSAGDDRTVVESSFVDSRNEGTVDHGAYYLVATVDRTAGFDLFDLDRISGGTGCNEHDIAVRPVPGVRIPFRTLPCTGTTIPTSTLANTNAVDCFFSDVDLWLDPGAAWFSEAGANAPPALIAGVEVLYWIDETGSIEPTSSDPCPGMFQPARDPSDPMRALGAIPIGTTAATVAVPTVYGAAYWFATRLVYVDSTLNPSGGYDPLTEPGPRLTTPLSGHCGPVVLPAFGVPLPTFFTKDDGVGTGFALAPGDPITYVLRVWDSGELPWDLFDVEFRDVLLLCIDASGFDPEVIPGQVVASPAASSVSWDPVGRELVVVIPKIDRGGSAEITISGLKAGPTLGECCNIASLEASGCSDLRVPSSDRENPFATSWSPTCTLIGDPSLCAPLPPPVQGVLAVKTSSGVHLEWDPALDPVTEHYNVYRVETGDKTLIPDANGATVTTRPAEVRALCLDVPLSSVPSCDDTLPMPDLAFYQVRAACADGFEGIDHPF